MSHSSLKGDLELFNVRGITTVGRNSKTLVGTWGARRSHFLASFQVSLHIAFIIMCFVGSLLKQIVKQ